MQCGTCFGAVFHAAGAPQDNPDIELALIANFVAGDFNAKRSLVQPFGCDFGNCLRCAGGDLQDRLAAQICCVGITVGGYDQLLQTFWR